MFEEKFEAYESIDFKDVHKNIVKFLPPKNSALLDIGAGSGRDASALAKMGYQVTAIEPDKRMLSKARAKHGNRNIRWMDCKLPELHALGNEEFEGILLSAVWMFVPPILRGRSIAKISSHLKEGGYLYITYRDKIGNDSVDFNNVIKEELYKDLNNNSLELVFNYKVNDLLGRSKILWHGLIAKKINKPKM